MKVSRRDNLDRYYLFQGFGIGIFLHHMHHDEDADVFHSHPWDGISFMLGSYLEERYGKKPKRRYFTNIIKATRFHRVTLPSGPVWSLFIHGRRYNKWAVKRRDGKILATEPWRDITGPTAYDSQKEKQ